MKDKLAELAPITIIFILTGILGLDRCFMVKINPKG